MKTYNVKGYEVSFKQFKESFNYTRLNRKRAAMFELWLKGQRNEMLIAINDYRERV